MDELIGEFLTETNESLDELDLDLVNLEQNPNDADLLGKIFRLMHTIKGTCGFLALPRLEKCAHHAENVLGRFRDGDLEVTPDYVTLIFESIDRIKLIVGELEETGSEPEGNDAELIEKLDVVYEGREVDASGADAAPEAAEESEPEGGYPGEAAGNVSKEELDALEAAFQNAPGPGSMTNGAANGATNGAAEPETEVEVEVAVEAAPEPAPTPEGAKEEAPAKAKESKGPPITTQTLRVNVDVLENLMTMVSELVLTRNQLVQLQRSNGENAFSGPLQNLNLVVSDLQEGVMQTRMQPIGNAWSKLPRIIRDLGMELNKKIELEMIGQDTELDRQVLELIKDPLTHMVRNSGDHGIEGPEERVAAGKPEMGRIVLRAFHEGGHIIIEIEDDGKGLPLDKIKDKILSNGLASEEELAEMSPQQINQFIFKAGFSTAEKVTSVSGRGVGMDVVRTNIEKIGGFIELHSVEGKGSTFTIKIPLTLAIVSALIVAAGEERFAIPQISVRELVMTSRHGDSKIEMIKGAPVLRLRDHLLPLVSLSDLLEINGEKKPIEDAIEALSGDDEKSDTPEDNEQIPKTLDGENRNQYIVVTQVGTYDFGIIVDRVFDTEEIVVKPVAKMLREIDMFSGNTILGDGSVIMILDPNGIARHTGEMDIAKKETNVQEELSATQSKTSLLLFTAGDATPKAVPLSLVARLENIDLSRIERSSGQMLVQYREQLMPLVPFNVSVKVGSEGEKPVIVFTDKTQSMGVIVDEIIDIKEEHIDVQLAGQQLGLMGSCIIDGKATDVVDIAHFLGAVNPMWFKDHGDDPYTKGYRSAKENEAGTGGTSKRRVLVVDDSPFFRNMLTPLLSVAGYDVTSLETPAEALEMCEKGVSFDVIVSDIEMPYMDGFEFAEKVRSAGGWQNTPMVALSSHATPQDIDRGLEVGFTKYIAKFDKDTLLTTLAQALSEDHNALVTAAE